MESSSVPTSPTTFGLCLLQPTLRPPDETPLSATRRVIDLADRAIAENPETRIDMFVLPELCPIGYSEDTFANFLPSNPERYQILDEIDVQLRAAAQRWKAAVCYGTIGRETDNSTDHNHNYYIRQLVIDQYGEIIASYDKIHLCDYGDCAETRFFTPGTSTVSCSVNGWKFGLIVCADIRYPALSRMLVQKHNIDVLLQPACFSRDISFRTWKPFRETRAVENGVYFVAGNYAGSDFGEAALVPPWVDEDHEPTILGTEEGYLLAQLDRTVLDQARDELPFYRNARKESLGYS